MSCQMEFHIETEGNKNKRIKRSPLTAGVKLSAVYTNLEKIIQQTSIVYLFNCRNLIIFLSVLQVIFSGNTLSIISTTRISWRRCYNRVCLVIRHLYSLTAVILTFWISPIILFFNLLSHFWDDVGKIWAIIKYGVMNSSGVEQTCYKFYDYN
jgi:hypothetical protein